MLHIRNAAGHVFVGTHINPSAGCELVFSEQFGLQASFTGRLLANLSSDELLLHENEIHFVSQHAARLKIADLLRRNIIEVYPPKIDGLRLEYSNRLRSHMPSRQWCIDTDSICDPSAFDCELDGPAAVSPTSNTFAFIVVFDPAGFGPEAARAVPRQRVAYVYGRDGGNWVVRRENLAGSITHAKELLGP